MANISRRKFISISGIAIGMSLLPTNVMASDEKVTWNGTALGAQANMSLYTKDVRYTKQIIQECVTEIRRLERVFSLFHRDSAVVQLNKKGVLHNPPKELVEVLTFAQTISQQSKGAFDVTVQPLWILHASHFAKKDADKDGPSQDEIIKAKKAVGWKSLDIQKDKIQFNKTGMSVTLNGIAQGYITDKITELLENRGFTNVLIDLGEMRALGNHPSGRTWQVAAPYSREVSNNEGYIKLSNQAVASSGGYGTSFNKKYHHLFNPHSGTSANYVKSVSIVASSAMLADALSTTVAVMPKKEARKLLNLYPNITAYIS